MTIQKINTGVRITQNTLRNVCEKVNNTHKIKQSLAEKYNKQIIAMTFPKQDLNLGLEPSVLTVLPDGENVHYLMDHNNIDV